MIRSPSDAVAGSKRVKTRRSRKKETQTDTEVETDNLLQQQFNMDIVVVVMRHRRGDDAAIQKL